MAPSLKVLCASMCFVVLILVESIGADQIFSYQLGDLYSKSEVRRMMRAGQSKPAQVINLLAEMSNKDEKFGSLTVNKLIEMNHYNPSEDCAELELEARFRVCKATTGHVKNYCNQCQNYIRNRCAVSSTAILASLGMVDRLLEAYARYDIGRAQEQYGEFSNDGNIVRFTGALEKDDRMSFERFCEETRNQVDHQLRYFQQSPQTFLINLRNGDEKVSAMVRTCMILIRPGPLH